MSRSSFLLLVTICGSLLLASCQKDELTVVSTAPPPHTCGLRTIEVNVDSLIQESDGGWGNLPKLHYQFCSCDTVTLVPVNIQDPWYFGRWYFGVMPDETDYYEEVLDSITVETMVTLDIHNNDGPPEPQHLHFRIYLEEVSCE